MKIQQFQPGDWVRIKSDKPHGEALQRGVPVKWVFRWNDKGTIIGPVENHPDQYYVRKAKTGRTIKRSGKSLSKIPVPDDQEQVGQDPPQLEENDIGENWNINHLFMFFPVYTKQRESCFIPPSYLKEREVPYLPLQLKREVSFLL